MSWQSVSRWRHSGNINGVPFGATTRCYHSGSRRARQCDFEERQCFMRRSWGDDGPTLQRLHELAFDIYKSMAKEVSCKSFRKLSVLTVTPGLPTKDRSGRSGENVISGHGRHIPKHRSSERTSLHASLSAGCFTLYAFINAGRKCWLGEYCNELMS